MKLGRIVWILAGMAAISVLAMQADQVAAERRTEGETEPEARRIDLFEGIDSGEIAVKFIPKDSTTAMVLIENKSDKPVSIRLPEAFAGVPALAQGGFGGGGFGGGGLGGGGLGGGGLGGGGGQGLGGGFGGGGLGGGGLGGGGFGGGGLGGGGGFFSVAPEKVGKIKVPCVCLEHGKTDPNPRMEYQIVPIESFTDNAQVVEICKMLGRREIPQNAAQAATWNVANGVSWQELATKNRVEMRTIGYSEKYFTPQELQLALRISRVAAERAEQNPLPTSSEDAARYRSNQVDLQQ